MQFADNRPVSLKITVYTVPTITLFNDDIIFKLRRMWHDK
jgi:hypothetical protein